MTPHTLASSSLAMIATIIAAMAVVAAIEAAIPLHPRGYWHRAHLAPNLVLTLVTFATNFVFNSALVIALSRIETARSGFLSTANLPPVLVVLTTVGVLDFAFYVAHVCMHKLPALWRFHSVHHSDPVVDVTTTIRQHPGESLIRYVFMGAVALLAGVPLTAFAVYRMWSALAGLLEHANVRLPLAIDDALSLVISTPNFHKVHHSRAPEHRGTNYGNCFSLFDALFRTRTAARHGVEAVCGVDGMDDVVLQKTAGLLMAPFRPVSVSVGEPVAERPQ